MTEVVRLGQCPQEPAIPHGKIARDHPSQSRGEGTESSGRLTFHASRLTARRAPEGAPENR